VEEAAAEAATTAEHRFSPQGQEAAVEAAVVERQRRRLTQPWRQSRAEVVRLAEEVEDAKGPSLLGEAVVGERPAVAAAAVSCPTCSLGPAVGLAAAEAAATRTVDPCELALVKSPTLHSQPGFVPHAGMFVAAAEAATTNWTRPLLHLGSPPCRDP
jgi:hypothetical protein